MDKDCEYLLYQLFHVHEFIDLTLHRDTVNKIIDYFDDLYDTKNDIQILSDFAKRYGQKYEFSYCDALSHILTNDNDICKFASVYLKLLVKNNFIFKCVFNFESFDNDIVLNFYVSTIKKSDLTNNGLVYEGDFNLLTFVLTHYSHICTIDEYYYFFRYLHVMSQGTYKYYNHKKLKQLILLCLSKLQSSQILSTVNDHYNYTNFDKSIAQSIVNQYDMLCDNPVRTKLHDYVDRL